MQLALALLLAVSAVGAVKPDLETAGPRGPVGPGTPLTAEDSTRFARRILVEEPDAAGVQVACQRAAKEGFPVVFLPAGEYEFEKTVLVPAGLTILGDGTKTVCRAKGGKVQLFHVEGDNVRFTRLMLRGADSTTSIDNDTYGIVVSGRRSVRIDHCEALGFSHATDFSSEAAAQVDHCSIHDNLRDGLGYGVALYSGAHVLVCDNEFSQNRHSLASNGALDWGSPARIGRYLHKPGVRGTHWEFIHNRVGGNDRSNYEQCAVDTHPGMDGTFVVEANVFENLRHAVGIRDGSGIIRGNLFRNLRTVTDFRSVVAISIGYGTHNDIPVEGCMPHDIQVEENSFGDMKDDRKCVVGQAENITVEGGLLEETRKDRLAEPPIPRLIPID